MALTQGEGFVATPETLRPGSAGQAALRTFRGHGGMNSRMVRTRHGIHARPVHGQPDAYSATELDIAAPILPSGQRHKPGTNYGGSS